MRMAIVFICIAMGILVSILLGLIWYNFNGDKWWLYVYPDNAFPFMFLSVIAAFASVLISVWIGK